MKPSRIFRTILSLTLLVLVVFIVARGCGDGFSTEEARLMSQIKNGMDTTQVRAILGFPDGINRTSDSCLIYDYFSRNKLWSTMPYVLFDSNYRVRASGYSDGY